MIICDKNSTACQQSLSGSTSAVKCLKINHVIPYVNTLKQKNHAVISIGREKIFEKTHSRPKKQTKSLSKLRKHGNILNLIKTDIPPMYLTLRTEYSPP